MLSRQAIIKHSLLPVFNFSKVENAALLHTRCIHHLRSSLSECKHLNKYQRNIFSSGLLVRYESSSSSQPSQLNSSSSINLDPIPEPPSLLPEIREAPHEMKHFSNELHTSSVNLNNPSDESYLIDSSGPDIYKAAIEVFSSLSRKDEYLGSRVSQRPPKDPENVVIDSSDTMPEIYKTAVEIWKDDKPSQSVLEQSFSNERVINKTNDATSTSTSSAQQLTNGNHTDVEVTDIHQQQSSNYSSIFDSLPDPPVHHNVTSSVSEAFTNEPPFASMDLGGWTPVGMIQNAMEYLHIDCGLPWWGAVVCGTLVIRLCMFPIVIMSQRNIAKVNNNMPQVQLFQAKINLARQRGDKYEVARISNELMMFMKEKEINPLKNMVPPLLQAPFFISMFMGLRGMSGVPVESLKTGGLFWFTDLTVPDQFYLLPLITSATLYCTLKVGADAGTPTQNSLFMKYFVIGLPMIMVPFTINFQGLILVYWTTTNFISLAQVGILRIPKVRDYFKIDKLIKHVKTDLPIKDKGFVNNVKDAWTNIKITSELEQRERVDKMTFLKAGREPIKKTYKYDPTQVRSSSTTAQAKKRL